MIDSRARPAASPYGHPAEHHDDGALGLPAQRAGAGPDGLVGLGAEHAVDDQRLEPGVPGAAHLGGPGVDLRGGERDLAGVADDRVAHRGRVGVADRLGDVLLDHLDGQPHHLDRLVEADNARRRPAERRRTPRR